MRDRTGDNGTFGHQPPRVVWWCGHKPRRLILRIFLWPDGWYVMRQQLRVPLADWLVRTGSSFTVEDVQEGRVVAMGARRVDTADRLLPLDIDTWPTGETFEVGCQRGPVRNAEIAWLAEDCRRARDLGTQIVRILG